MILPVDESIAIVNEFTSDIPQVTVIEALGKSYILRPTSAAVYLKYNDLKARKSADADIYLLKQIYELDGSPLTDADAVAILRADAGDTRELLGITSSFDGLVTIGDGKEFGSSKIFRVGDVQIQRKAIPGGELGNIRAKLGRSLTKGVEEAIGKYYEARLPGDDDYQSIAGDLIELPYPQGIGFAAMAAVVTNFLSLFGADSLPIQI